jgi:hypothetical protein
MRFVVYTPTNITGRNRIVGCTRTQLASCLRFISDGSSGKLEQPETQIVSSEHCQFSKYF